jgi:short-subunit dehydrogenase
MTSFSFPWRIVWITGASTGIGRELALLLAKRGCKVAVSARSADRLAALQAEHPNISAFPLDVTDLGACEKVVADIEAALGPIELAVLNAAVWREMGVTEFDPEFIAEAMNINYIGTINALAPVMQRMLKRASGWIAMTGSVAGYRGLPRSAAYAPTKAAMISLAEGLKEELARKGVGLTIINPGFVETPMTAVNDFPMPFIVSADAAAHRIMTGLERKKFEIVFPRQMRIGLKLLRILPYSLYFWIVRNYLPSGPRSKPN